MMESTRLEALDVAKIHIFMLSTGWQGGTKTPTAAELRSTARGILDDLASDASLQSAETGGLTADRVVDGCGTSHLRIKFDFNPP